MYYDIIKMEQFNLNTKAIFDQALQKLRTLRTKFLIKKELNK